MLRESGASSTLRLLGSITDASGILVHPPSRVMTIGERDTASRSRRRFARGSSLNFPPSEDQRAQGMPGAQCTRSLVCAGVVEYAHEYSQRRHRKHPAFPTQWFYGLYRALPGDRALLPPSFAGLTRDLGASVGASGPHDFAVRVRRARQARRQRPPHPASRVRDVAQRPSVGRDQIAIMLIWGWGQEKILKIGN